MGLKMSRLTSSMLEPKPRVTSSTVEQQQDRQEDTVGRDHGGLRARPALSEREAGPFKSCLCLRPRKTVERDRFFIFFYFGIFEILTASG